MGIGHQCKENTARKMRRRKRRGKMHEKKSLKEPQSSESFISIFFSLSHLATL
jgi:hypothetical protein